MRVLAITNNLKQASFRLRIAALAEGLLRQGIELDIQVRPRRILAHRRLLRSAANYDAVILQRKMLDPTDARLLRRYAARIVFDVDDAVMFHNRKVGPIVQWRTTRRFRATYKNVDIVVAGNEYLAELFKARGVPGVIVPTVVDPAHYRIKSHAATTAPALVWIGSRSTLGYLQRCVPAIAAAARKVPGLRLITIADETLAHCPVPLQHIPWSAETEADALCQGDIGIAPTPEDRWTLGKCGFKILQYMAAGLPVIASPVGANARIVQSETGLLPEETEDWATAIEQLASNPTQRSALGSAGRKRVEDHFSIKRATDQWAQLLNTLISGDIDSVSKAVPSHSIAR